MNRVLAPVKGAKGIVTASARLDAAGAVCRRIVDFASLKLPADVRLAFAEAFWGYFGPRPPQTVISNWSNVKVFARFVVETRALRNLSDVSQELLVRYIEWLNRQCDANGAPWSKGTRASRYTTLCMLLQWLERCRPSRWEPLDYPSNPFPWRNRDYRPRQKISAQELRTLLMACERDIAQERILRERGEQERTAAGVSNDPASSLGALLNCVAERFDGVVPPKKILQRRGNVRLYRSLPQYGGLRAVEAYLYPSPDAMLPYYLAILLHTAGNAEAIAELGCDCLQPIPLLQDRETLVWTKSRAAAPQRRSFRRSAPFEPPSLVREILEWTGKLRPRLPVQHRSHLFVAKTAYGVRPLKRSTFVRALHRFAVRHGLPSFTFASIRPSVLTAIYRASGDLRQVKTVANHRRVSTTIGYVEGPELEGHDRARVATLQRAFLEQLCRTSVDTPGTSAQASLLTTPGPHGTLPTGIATSMFGFGCKDPFAGIAPGSRVGELCTNFLGCLTCPNAVIASDPTTVARLLQARAHLCGAAAQLDPARWEAIYAPQLRILEEDILSGFSARELAQAEPLMATLPPLPPLR